MTETSESPKFEPGADRPDDGLSDPMHHWERIGSAVLGILFGGFGTLAVFKSDNQAGTAGLMLAAIVFLLIGVQGTALVKLGSGGSNVELERRRRRALEEAKQEPNPDVVDGMLRAAEIMAPELPPSSAERAAVYERQVAQAIRRIVGNVGVSRTRNQGGPDLLTKVQNGKTVAIDVRYRTRGPITRRDISRITAQAAMWGEVGAIVVVTNAPLSGGVEEFNRQFAGKLQAVEVVTWNDEQDDDLQTFSPGCDGARRQRS